jgi:transposase
MQFVGLDIHWKTTTICILDENGHQVKRRTICSGWRAVLGYCRQIKKPFAVCFEASCGYGYLYDELSEMASRVVVAHPGQLRLIFRCKRKNDRVDAEKLAKLLYLDEVPPVYVPSVDLRHWRGLIEYRQTMVAKRVRCKNGLRALLRSQGIVAPKGLWSRRGIRWLESSALDGELLRIQRDTLLAELALFDMQIDRVTAVLDRLGALYPGVALLRTIPGVGPRTAEAVVAYVGDPSRFGRTRQAGAYFGLVPCQDASAGSNRLGHITKEGPATVRKLVVEATWQVVRRCPRTKQRFERLTQGKKERRKIALVAVAHHLIRCMTSMLRTGELWRVAA